MLRLFSKRKDATAIDKDVNWNMDRYSVVIAQRNVLLLLVLLALIAISVSLFVVLRVTNSKTIEPFIIEIKKNSGIIHVVDPVTVKQYSADAVLNNHFILDYVKTRELFDVYNYDYNYYTKVRLFSSYSVYNEFKNSIQPQDVVSSISLYSSFVKSDFKVRSIQKIGDNKYQIRFTLEFLKKDGTSTNENKIAVLSYRYASLEMDEQQRYLNPLGFQVISYRLDDEYV